MRTNSTNSLIEHLRRAVLLPDCTAFGDAVLLGRFIESHDEAAFAVLVNRHGPMVWGVCRRLLHQHDAEDAFQATFLVLARKAASIRSTEVVGNWLYGVAHQTAMQARRTAARRRAKEVQVTTMPDIEAAAPDPGADIQPLLDEELSRLPDIYRGVIVLCDLEGRTRREVASHLSVPEGTVAARLARARTMLAKRLTHRGVTLSGGALAAVLSQQAASAGVPNSVVISTIKAASLLAARQAAATGAMSVKVAALTEGVMKAMLFTKLKAAIAVVLILGFMATGGTLLTYRAAVGQDDAKPATSKSVALATEQKADKEPLEEPDIRNLGKSDIMDFPPFTAWSEEYPGGVQVGLGYRPGEKRVYYTGEIVTLAVRVRNVGKKEMLFWYHRQPTEKTPPKVTDTDGKTLLFPMKDQEVEEDGVADVSLAPGAQTDLYYIRMKLSPAGERSNKGYMTLYGTGKFRIQEMGLKGESSLGKFGNGLQLSPMLCGKVELEVKEAQKNRPQKQERKETVKETQDDAVKLLGNWTVVSAERDGKPDEDPDHPIHGRVVTFTKKKPDTDARFAYDMEGTFANAGNIEAGYKLDSSKSPKVIEFLQWLDVGGKFKPLLTKNIYRFDGDQLWLCLQSAQEGEKAPTEFVTKKGDGLFLLKLKRRPAKDAKSEPQDKDQP